MASSVTQHGVPSLSSAEAEIRAISRGYCDGKYLQFVMQDLGVDTRLELYSDSSAALDKSAKLGPGRLPHSVTSALMIKSAVRAKDVILRKSPHRTTQAIFIRNIIHRPGICSCVP